MRDWSDAENNIIRENYPEKGCVVTARLLHAAGFDDRGPVTVMKQASKLKVKKVTVSRFTADYSRRREMNSTNKAKVK